MKYTNKYNLHDALVSAIAADWYEQDGRISVTWLIGPPRIRQLKMRYADHLEEDVSEGIWRLLGSAVHGVLERAEVEGTIQERRISTEILGWRVTGQADLWTPPATLDDYKVTSAWSAIREPKPDWISQLNCYARLTRLDGRPVEALRIIAIYRDWSRSRAKRDKDYPKIAAGVISIPCWPDEQAAKYMEDRVRLHQEAGKLDDGDLPLCTPEERWDKPTTWAVRRKGRKSALRVLDTEEEAKANMEPRGAGHYIEERPGESTRCLGYCPVADFCDFGRMIKKEQAAS